MKTNVYSIYDSARELFIIQLYADNDKVVEMNVTEQFKSGALKQIQNLYSYPNNFRLVKIGTFDNNLGVFENEKIQKDVLNFGDLVEKTDDVIS